jgi:hypothetical protein
MMQIQFSDKMVTYETFVNDIAARLCEMMALRKDGRLFVSQNEAFRTYGRANVERWRTKGWIEPRKTKGKLEYSTDRLAYLANIKQDYF